MAHKFVKHDVVSFYFMALMFDVMATQKIINKK